MSCDTCCWWEPYSAVCCNGESPRCADFWDEGCAKNGRQKRVTKDEAIKAAETLKEWCDGLPCRYCPFTNNKNSMGCIFRNDSIPMDWKFPKTCRWTDTDVELAKALKAAGAQVIVLTNTGVEWRSESPAGTIRCGGKVPPFAFTCVTFADGEIPLDTIIQEAKEG